MVSTSAKRFPISYFGFFDVPYLPLGQSQTLGGLMHESHELLGYGAIMLIALHVAAALKHHYFDRDDVLAAEATDGDPKQASTSSAGGSGPARRSCCTVATVTPLR